MWPFTKASAPTPLPARLISPDDVRAAIGAIEDELQRTGLSSVGAPTPEALAGAGAFGQPTLAYEQWLVHVFVPRVHAILESGGSFPPESHVGFQAVREWQMWGNLPAMEELTRRLQTFDAIFNP